MSERERERLCSPFHAAEQMRFALTAAVDTLPHNANLHLRKKKDRMAAVPFAEKDTHTEQL